MLLLFLSSCSDDSKQTSAQKQAITISAPVAPKSINVIPGDSQAILTWARVENADSYNLYMATEPGVGTETYATLAGGLRQENITSPHIISDLQNGKTYYLVLTSKNPGGESQTSQEISLSPISAMPVPPTPVLTKAKPGANKIDLAWNEIPDILQYHIYLTYPDDAGQDLAGSTQQFTVRDSSYTLKGLENGKTYFFALSAENEAGESELSEVLSAMPKPPVIRPAPPRRVSVTDNKEGSVTIDWDSRDDIDQYDLFISSDAALSSRNFKQLADSKAVQDILPPYTVSNLTPKTYYFVLNARNKNGISRDSKTVSIDLRTAAEKIAAEAEPLITEEKNLEEEDGNRPYEKLGLNGELLEGQRRKYGVQPWACVRNKETGKMWEVKTLDGSFRRWDRTYPWRHPDNGDCTDDICSVEQYVEKINQMRLCGFDDWRLPTRDELASLLDKNQQYPTPKINIRFFPNTGNNFYWSGTTYKYDSELAWFVYFSSGYQYFDIKTNPMHIRVVRDGKTPSDQ